MSNWLLQIEIIPASSWGLTLANKLPKDKWDYIRKKVYSEAGFVCDICKKDDTKFHCHEVWKFDDKKFTQTLIGFACLCKMCHDCIHFGRSENTYSKSYVKKLLTHFAKVNKVSEAEILQHVEYMRRKYSIRYNHKYKVKVGDREA